VGQGKGVDKKKWKQNAEVLITGHHEKEGQTKKELAG